MSVRYLPQQRTCPQSCGVSEVHTTGENLSTVLQCQWHTYHQGGPVHSPAVPVRYLPLGRTCPQSCSVSDILTTGENLSTVMQCHWHTLTTGENLTTVLQGQWSETVLVVHSHHPVAKSLHWQHTAPCGIGTGTTRSANITNRTGSKQQTILNFGTLYNARCFIFTIHMIQKHQIIAGNQWAVSLSQNF